MKFSGKSEFRENGLNVVSRGKGEGHPATGRGDPSGSG